MEYLPTISSGTVHREIVIDNYFGILLKDISAGMESNIQYHYLLIMYQQDSIKPILCLSSEWSNVEPQSVDVPFLCAFTNEGHLNFGNSEKWANIELFFPKSLTMVKEWLKLSTDSQVNVSKPNIIEKPIREKSQIIDEFHISEETFNIKYSSYHRALIMYSQNIGFWNDEIEDYSRKILSEAEIQRAKYDLHQAILNRVIVALASENNFEQKKSSNPWWKFWNQ